MDYKKRVKLAVDNWSIKQLKKDSPSLLPKKKNKTPEADFLKKLKKHIEENHGWSLDVIDSKGQFSEDAQRYVYGKTRSGYSDMSGNMLNGLASYLEVKAPGKRSTLREDQMNFLIEKINSNCFAIVTDSIEHFEMILEKFKKAENRKAILLNDLPKGKANQVDDGPLF